MTSCSVTPRGRAAGTSVHAESLIQRMPSQTVLPVEIDGTGACTGTSIGDQIPLGIGAGRTVCARARTRSVRAFELELVAGAPGEEVYDDDCGRGATGAIGPQV